MSLYQFGRYIIKSKIKRGGMAAVFHAYDPHFRRDVALKVLPPEFTDDPNFRARFEREARTIAALEHPAIVPVYDFGSEGKLLYLVMRYLIGGSLSDRLKKGPLGLNEAVRIIAHLAPALDAVHHKGIIHRDLKPGNILFDQHDTPYITDFGIVKIDESDKALTLTGMILGTPSYMSPEQARGDSILDGRSDIYSLGVILFQMLAGQLPFQSDTPMGVALKHIVDPTPNILEIKPELPPGCQMVIAQAMAKEPENRYVTASVLAEALTDLTKSPPPAESSPGSVVSTQRQPLATEDSPDITPALPPEAHQDNVLRFIYELDDPTKYIFARSELLSLGNEAIKTLTEMLMNNNKTSVRSNSARMLKQICKEQDVKSLLKARTIKALTKALSDPEVAVRYCSLQALSIFKGRQVELAVEPVGTLLEDPDEDIRELAQQTLKNIGGKHARKILKRYNKKGWF